MDIRRVRLEGKAKKALQVTKRKPTDFFKTFDLGEGGYAFAPAREACRAVKASILRKAQR